MNFKPDLLPMVEDGTKTNTRRIKKPNEFLSEDGKTVYTRLKNGKVRIKWQVGRTYAAAPGRGKHQTCRTKLLALSEELASNISEEDSRREGFADRAAFFAKWDSINGKNKRDVAVWVHEFELVKPA